jgi:small ligand-binding sensory domain FIST
MLRVAVGHSLEADACDGIEQAVGMLGETGAAASETPMPGLLYLSQALAGQAGLALAHARELLPRVEWYGAVVPTVFGVDAELDPDSPALMVALLPVPPGQWQRTGTGSRSRPASTSSALLHVSPELEGIADTIDRCAARYESMIGGLVASDDASGRSAQFAGNAMLEEACSGIAFNGEVGLRSRLSQGCRPLAREHVISHCTAHYIQMLDGEPALDVLLSDLGVPEEVRRSTDGDEILRALPAHELRRGLLVGLSVQSEQGRVGFGDYTVRQLVGIDPTHRILAIADTPRSGDHAVFCTRDLRSAHADLIRVCTELREEVESEGLDVIGAHYVSCASRPSLFGSTRAELEILRHNLGDVPIFGFFANGEISGGRIHGHSGVLSLLVRPPANG